MGEIDVARRELQDNMHDKWVEFGGLGFVEGFTGFGKTYIGLRSSKTYFSKPRKHPCDVVVNSSKMQEVWKEQMASLGLDMSLVRVFVVNTYAKLPMNERTRGLLILDEADLYANQSAEIFNNVFSSPAKFVLALSATFTGKQKEFMVSKGLRCAGSIGFDEALERGWVSPVKQYNVPVALTSQESGEYDKERLLFKKGWKMLPGDLLWEFDLNDTLSYHRSLEKKQGKPFPYTGYQRFGIVSRARIANRNYNRITNTCIEKLRATKHLCEHLHGKKIVFCKDTSFADDIKNALGDAALAYHSKIKPRFWEVEKSKFFGTTSRSEKAARRFCEKVGGILETNNEGRYIVTYTKPKKETKKDVGPRVLRQYTETPNVHTLVSVEALNRGFDYTDIRAGIIVAGTRSEVDFMQRLGRVVRKKGGRANEVVMVNFYASDTHEVQKIKKMQKKLAPGSVIELGSMQELCDVLGLPEYKRERIKLD